jgi:fibronectin type 3 domain-containing protein
VKLRNCLLVFVIMGLTLSTFPIMANDASAAGTYDYKVSSNAVLDSGGTTVYTGATFTAALNWAVNHANTRTYVPAGTYALTTHVYFASGTTLFGDGDATTFTATSAHNFYLNGVSDVTLSSFKFTGHLQVYGYKAGGTCGDWTFTDIHATALTGDMEAGFWMYVGSGGIIDGITFTSCTVTYSQTYGFLLFGDDTGYTGNSLIKNVNFVDCEASHNGNDNVGWINAWITGFDLVECTSVENIILTRCVATYNWCSGFHIEYGATPKNVQLIDCVTSYNGQKPNCEQYYGYGFKFQNFQVPGVSCVRLTGTGNHEGFTPIAMTATSLNMKVWMNSVAGKASTGTWYPAGAPGANSDLIFTKSGSNANCNVDTQYKSVRNIYYYGGTITYSTPVPGTAPSAPTSLAATLTAGKVALTWNAPSTNGGSAITSYNIYRGTVSGSTALLGTSTSLAYTDSNVVVGTTYYYVVKAVNSVSTSAASNEASCRIPSVAPSAPTSLAATLTAGKVALTWNAPSTNGGSAITSYNIYRGTSAGSESALATSTSPAYTDSNVAAGATYYYLVRAVNAAGTSATSNEASCAIPGTAPSAPTSLSATLTAGKVALTWNAPSTNGGSAITSYSIYRGTSAGSESALATSTSLSYTDSNVAAGTTYYYVVKAVNSVSTSAASNEASCTIPSVAPSAPTSLSATLTAGKVALTWNAPSSSGSSPITSYSVYRGTNSALTNQVLIGTSSTTGYSDMISSEGTYYYTVKAVSSVGPSAPSTSISVVIKPAVTVPGTVSGLTAVGTSEQVSLKWSAPSNGGSAITGYNIYRGWSSGYETLVTTVGPVTSYTNGWLTNGVTYYFRVAAVNAVGTGAMGAEVFATPHVSTTGVPGTVTGLSATATGSSGVIKLTWSAPSNGGSAITGYNIYRSWSSGSETLVATVGPVTSYTNTWLTNGVTYYFKVAAINAVGVGALSAEVHASPHKG